MAPAKFLLTAFLLLLLPLTSPTLFARAATPAVAPGPTPAPLNLTGVLDKGGQYATLLRLLKETQVGQQLTSQLNSSFDGLTLFAPTDNAFSNLKPGTLNGLTTQQQVELVLYHVLPRFYSLTTFQTASNPLRTQASGNNGVYTVNVTSTTSQVNVSTGVDQVVISNVLYSEFPLAVYSVDNVLLPLDLFGVKPPAPAPEVAPKQKPKKAPADSTASAPAAEADATASGAGLKRIGWGFILGVGLLMSFANLF